jgi:hypothetical protein
MAANANFLYIGTNQDQLAVQVKKSNFAITQFSEVSGPYNVTSITADQYGFVTVTWGKGAGFHVINKNGQAQDGGGGDLFMLNTSVAILPSSQQVQPNRILAVTFTRTAANDLVDKLSQLGVAPAVTKMSKSGHSQNWNVA